jgi:hypothetical protein
MNNMSNSGNGSIEMAMTIMGDFIVSLPLILSVNNEDVEVR